jgi:peptide/nickel transport system substrate-binding protein
MLDDAGYPVKQDGWRFRINLKHTTGYSEHVKVAELVKDDFKKIGVDLQIISLDHAAWHEHAFKRWDFDTTILPFCGGPNPPTLKRFHTKNILRISWANNIGFSNSEYDRLFDAMISETDVKKRLKLTNRMQEILADEQPLAYIVSRLYASALKEGVFAKEPENVWALRYLWIHLDKLRPIKSR